MDDPVWPEGWGNKAEGLASEAFWQSGQSSDDSVLLTGGGLKGGALDSRLRSQSTSVLPHGDTPGDLVAAGCIAGTDTATLSDWPAGDGDAAASALEADEDI